MLARAFYARQDTLTPVLAAILAVVVNTSLAVVLVGPLRPAGHRAGDRHRRVARGARPARHPRPPAARLPRDRADRGRAGVDRRDRHRERGRARGADRPAERARGRAGPDHPARPDRGRDRGLRRGLRARLARVADPGTAVYRRGHGRRPPPPAPVVTGTAAEDEAWDAFVASSEPGSYLQLSGWSTVKAVNGWTVAPRIRRDGRASRIGAQVLVRRPRPMPWSFAYAPRGPVAADWTPADDRGLHGRGAGPASARSPAPGQPPADRPGDRGRRPARPRWRAPDGAPGGRAGGRRPPSSRPRRGSSTCAPDEAALLGDLRKKWRQYVNKARSAGIVVVDADGDRLGDFYRIYRETADRAGFLIRTEAAYRDVWDGVPAGRSRPAPVRPDARRRAAARALPRPLRTARRRAVRRHDRGRRGVAGELPPQVGGHPHLARAGRHELRPVGPRHRRDRPLQDRLRRPRGPLHRGVGPRARPARATGLRGGVGRSRTWVARRPGRRSPGTATAASFGADA